METHPESKPELPGFHLQMVETGPGTVGVKVRLGEVDPWTALTMCARAQVSLTLKIEEMEKARKAQAEATKPARSRLTFPGGKRLTVN